MNHRHYQLLLLNTGIINYIIETIGAKLFDFRSWFQKRESHHRVSHTL
jgi:hypothetical protein